jgi:hypothetical protein
MEAEQNRARFRERYRYLYNNQKQTTLKNNNKNNRINNTTGVDTSTPLKLWMPSWYVHQNNPP